MRIRIAFVIDTLSAGIGGTEKQLLLLLRHIDRKKFDPVLCCLREMPKLGEAAGFCPVHVVDFRSFKHLSSWVSLLRFSWFLRKNKIRIVQTHFQDSNAVGTLAALLAGIQAIVSTRRGVPYWDSVYGVKALKVMNLLATCFVANGQEIKEYVVAREGIPKRSIHVIGNALDLAPFEKARAIGKEACREKLGLSKDAFVVGIVANLRAVKGHEIFLRASRAVKDVIPQAEFVLVGDGPLKCELLDLASSLGMEDNVHFLGVRDDVPEVVNSFDVGVLSSHFESFPNAVVEYLAAGLPVVSTGVGGVGEIISSGVNGYLVPKGDYEAMSKYIIDIYTAGLPNARDFNKIGFVAAFDPEYVVKRYESLYLTLLI